MTRVGWCPGGRTVAEMLAMYPGTTAVRIFVGAGKPLPTWDGPVLGPIPAGVLIHVSFKTWDLPAVERWLMAMPADHAPIILTYAHEPEQGTAAGDPTVEQFRARWAELVAALADHPRRGDVLLVPVFTRYWWQAHPGDVRWLVPMVDAIGWDIYNNGSTYRTPDDLLTIPRDIAQRTGLPYLIAELGAVDIGPGRAAWMRAMVDAARTDDAWTVCWFHKDEWDLAATAGQATWRDIIAKETPVVTTAPQTLLDARQLLLTYLNVDKGSVRTADLEPAEVGIVGDANHRGGYHCGEDRVVPNDYSVVESSRDRTGLAKWACGLDVGLFEVTTPTGTYDLPHYSRWLVAQCEAGTPDTRDIREVIYSPDGKTVKRWDRLGRRTSGDSSHLFHTHQSYFRDAIKAGRDQTAVIRRYLTEIGLIEGDDDMQLTDTVKVINDDKVQHSGSTLTVEGILAQTNYYAILTRNLVIAHRAETATMRAAIDGLTAALAKVTTGGSVDTAGILAGIDQRLAAVRADMRDAVADLGEGGAEQVRGPQAALK